MKEVISSLIDSKISKFDVFVHDAFFEEVEGKKVLNIVLDSDEVIDLNRITEASRIINPIIDSTDLINQDYDELDIYSKEKGDVSDE